ncbi:MAG: flavodoxin family protein [Candidatus Hodarchaeales archaeon]
MEILIVYSSSTGNTKKVVDLIKEKFIKNKENQITVKNALTVKTEQLEEADLLIIGTPVHGHFIIGQGPTKEIKNFLNDRLQDNLNGKSVILFATYLFFPAKTLKKITKVIESKNGKVIGDFAKRRTKKEELSEAIVKLIKESI